MATTISTLLRNKDLELKKINKLVTNLLSAQALQSKAEPDEKHKTCGTTLQSIYDKLSYLCSLMHTLRCANVSITTDLKNYFTNEPMSIIECRQNIVSGQIKGAPSEVYYLTELQNHIAKQINDVKAKIKNHNNQKKAELAKILDTEKVNYERDRKSHEEIGGVPENFEKEYLERIEKKKEVFWERHLAEPVDPINIFAVLDKLSSWINNFNKYREHEINSSNEKKFKLDDCVKLELSEGKPTITLDKLNILMEDKRKEIINSINCLVVITWKIKSSYQFTVVDNALADYDKVLSLIKTYGQMQQAHRLATTLSDTGITNPLSGTPLTAIDALDLKNIIIPIVQDIINNIDTQTNEAKAIITQKETEVRAEISKLLEGSMTVASSRPAPEKMKEYADKLFESMSYKLLIAKDIDQWKTKFQNIIDKFETEVVNGLMTANVTTRVPITWYDIDISNTKVNWNNDVDVQFIEQLHINNVDNYDKAQQKANTRVNTRNNAKSKYTAGF